MAYKLPELSYDFNALGPYIDTRTMTIHFRMQFARDVDKLNHMLVGCPELQDKSVFELIHDLDAIPLEIQTATPMGAATPSPPTTPVATEATSERASVGGETRFC